MFTLGDVYITIHALLDGLPCMLAVYFIYNMYELTSIIGRVRAVPVNFRIVQGIQKTI